MRFTLGDLRRIMRGCAGADESVDLDGDIAQVPFADLGYDSLAVLETASRVEKEYGVSIPDDAAADLDRPAALIEYVNGQLTEVSR